MKLLDLAAAAPRVLQTSRTGCVRPGCRVRLGGQAFNLEPAGSNLAFALEMHFGTIRQRQQLWRTDECLVVSGNIRAQCPEVYLPRHG